MFTIILPVCKIMRNSNKIRPNKYINPNKVLICKMAKKKNPQKCLLCQSIDKSLFRNSKFDGNFWI